MRHYFVVVAVVVVHDDEKICGARLYLGSFFSESLGAGRKKREGTSASRKQHTNQKDQNKSDCLSVSGRNFIVASTRRDRHSLWRFQCPKSEWRPTFENTDTDFSKVSVRKVSLYPVTYTLLLREFSVSLTAYVILFIFCVGAHLHPFWPTQHDTLLAPNLLTTVASSFLSLTDSPTYLQL
jgi:hypothetical protein